LAALAASQPEDSRLKGPSTKVAPMNLSSPGSLRRKPTLLTLLNLATLGVIVAWLAFDWWAIAYLIAH
jgi:hypothetical protein